MPNNSSRRTADDEFAELATQAVVAVAMVGLVILGAIFVGAFREIARVYAQHGQRGQPKALQLKRAWQIVLAAWGVACVLALAGAAEIGALVGGIATIVFVIYVLTVGNALGEVAAPPNVKQANWTLTCSHLPRPASIRLHQC